VQRYLGIEMNGTFGAEAEAVLGQRDVAGIASIKVLTQGLGDPIVDPLAQCVADVEILA
jgi:hypothetical protein